MEYLITEKYEIQKEPIKTYENFTLYQIYGVIEDKKTALYKTCE